MMKNNSTLTPPWENYRNLVEAFFEFDDDILVEKKILDEGGEKHILVVVGDHNKFEALDKILTKKIVFGNITVIVDLYDAENDTDNSIDVATIEAAFQGNMMVDKLVNDEDATGTNYCYVVFDDSDLIQFYSDDLTDYHGNTTILPEHAAKKLFNVPWNIQFCTRDRKVNQ